MCSNDCGAGGYIPLNGHTFQTGHKVTYGAVQHVGSHSSPEDEHAFCPLCGYCVECGDCAIWGCGKQQEEDK